MDRILNAKVVFICLTILYVLFAVVHWLHISKEPIAIHFNTDGTPNDGMTGIGFMLFHVAMAAFMIGIRWLVAASARWQRGINIPDYQIFTNEQKQAFTGFMEKHSWKFGCLLMGIFIAIDGLIVWANAQTPPNLPITTGLVLTIGFLTGMGWWIIRLLMEIQHIKHASTTTLQP